MDKYAIIKTGSKQYRVSAGDVIDVELLEGEKNSKIEFSEVLFLSDANQAQVGAPTIAGATVIGEVIDQVRGPKVIAYKYKKRKNYRRKVGHRQNYTRVKITGV
ncbi:MAG: 50S ribosomal protein L21 [Chlamydiales bacterium]|nr:50S ribosomal protein L21 [Chlamydiales bacterium]